MLTKCFWIHHPTIGGVRLASVLKLIKYNVQHRRWALIRSGKRTRQRRGKRTFYVRILRLGIQVFLRIMRTSWIPRCLNKPYSTYKFLRRQLIYPGARDSLSVRYSSPMRNICCWSPQNSSEADMQILVRGPLLGSEKQSGMWQLTRGTNTRKTTFAVVSRPLHEGRKFR